MDDVIKPPPVVLRGEDAGKTNVVEEGYEWDVVSEPVLRAWNTWQMFRCPEYIAGLLFFAIVGASGMTLSSNLGSFTQSILGPDRREEFPRVRSHVVTLFSIASTASRVLLPSLSDMVRVRRGWLLMVPPALGIAGSLVLLTTPPVVGLLVFSGAWGLSHGGMVAMTALCMSELFGKGMFGRAWGYSMGSKAVGCAFLFPMVGLFYELEHRKQLVAGAGKMGEINCYGINCVAVSLWVIIGLAVLATWIGVRFMKATKIGRDLCSKT